MQLKKFRLLSAVSSVNHEHQKLLHHHQKMRYKTPMSNHKTEHQFQRMELITGHKALLALQNTRVIIFGIGGVGSWAAEALVRSGIGKLCIVDSDTICVTNINRQIQATTKTVGHNKVEALRDRLLAINPAAGIDTITAHYSRHNSAEFDLNNFDYVVDAIDSLSSKVELIINTLASSAKLFSSLGAARKLDPNRIHEADIWDTRGCRLGQFVRKRLRKRGIRQGFTCVYSDELIPTHADFLPTQPDSPNGSAAHITGIFGFRLCGLVLRDALKPYKEVRPLS
jgi:tRNA A37 threonylcarbamoyladenosine dehydratase